MPITVDLVSWLRQELGDDAVRGEGQELLNLMALAARRDPEVEIPDSVMLEWHRMLAQARISVKQSELQFIEYARRSNWSWTSIAEVLGHERADEALEYYENLPGELARLHPSHSSSPWLGLGG